MPRSRKVCYGTCELIERDVEPDPRSFASPRDRIVLCDAAFTNDHYWQTAYAVFAINASGFTRSSRAYDRRSTPAGTSNIPVSLPSGVDDGPNTEGSAAAFAAQCSRKLLDRNASFTRRTFELAEHELVEGNSREGDSVIFWTGFRHFTAPRRAAEDSLGFQPVAKNRSSSHLGVGAAGRASRRFLIAN